MSNEVAFVLDEVARWRARDVKYWGGTAARVLPLLPTFRLEDFIASGDATPNPHIRAVVRQPMNALEKRIAVGAVSNSYSLAQHRDVAQRCLDGIGQAYINPDALRCEVGLSELGEWMNFRVYFPAEYSYEPKDQKEIGLRLECFNSVDGSNRLVVFLGWFRFVCGNGMVIGETRVEIREVHTRGLDLDSIPFLIADAMGKISVESGRLKNWDNELCEQGRLASWINGSVADKWGSKAASRVYHIAQSGYDVEISDLFVKAKPTEKQVTQAEQVPGAVVPAQTLYDVSQALTWVATHRKNVEERVQWQSDVTPLMNKLSTLTQPEGKAAQARQGTSRG